MAGPRSVVRLALLAVWAATLACGRVGFGEFGLGGGDGGAGRDGPATGDGPIGPGVDAAATVCGAWGTATELPTLGSADIDWEPDLAGDGLTLLLTSERAGSPDLYIARRPARGMPFTSPQPITELNTGGREDNGTLTADLLELYYHDGACIRVSRRDRATDPWGVSTELPLCATNEVTGPDVSADGLRLVYNTVLGGQNAGDIYISTRASRANNFGPGQPVAELAGLPYEGFPALSSDGLTLYFERGVSVDLFEVKRADSQAPWGTPTPLPFNSGSNDGDVDISADGTELFFGSDRGGDFEIYQALRTCQ